jgi:hypothetical protein
MIRTPVASSHLVCSNGGMTESGNDTAVARVLPVGAVTTAALLWRDASELQLTVVVQTRLAMQHERMMLLVEPRPLVAKDVHRDEDPTKSLVMASDLVPFRPRVDVWMTGHAHAPGGCPVRVGLVRLAIYRGSTRLLDKVVHVQGDRTQADAAPAAFERLPLVYERAYGGAGFDANPVGVGADDRPALPNLIHPDHPEHTACFAPISRYWRVRRQHITSELRRELDRPIPHLGGGLDWRYFQAAPADQQLDRLAGDEWLVLDGIDATLLRLQTRLPKIRGVARLVGQGGGVGDAIALEADTLAIDADAKEVRVTWRGVVRVGSKDELAGLRIAAGVEQATSTVDWTAAMQALYDEPTLIDSLSPRALGDLRRDTLVSADARSEEDALGHTTVDPPRVATESSTDDPLERTDVSVKDVPADELEQTMRSRVSARALRPQRYPRAPRDEEVTETQTSVQIGLTRERDELPAQVDTLPSGMAVAWEEASESDDTTVHRADDLDATDVPPPVAARRLPPRPRAPVRPLPSAFPPPLDPTAHAKALRDAGASDEDIAAARAALDED